LGKLGNTISYLSAPRPEPAGLAMSIMDMSAEQIKKALREGEITICVIGLGRIGLPTAAVFAEAGAKVLGADINPRIVQQINSGNSPFTDEPGLNQLLGSVVKQGKLAAVTDVPLAVAKADVIVICVPTPVDETKSPDYSAIEAACKEIAKALKTGSLIIVESTVGPATVENLVAPLLEKLTKMKVGADFGVVSCPERADPGRILENIKGVPRVVGGIDRRCTEAAATLYEAALQVKVVRVSDPKTANAVKLTENLFRDVNIALANEFALLYEKLAIDTIEVINACATKYNFMPHYPGPGVGGPCLPSNPYYLIVEGLRVGNIPYLVRMAREINDRMPDHVVTLVTEALNEVDKTVKGARIVILGAAYKPNIHDMQLTPLRRIYEELKEMGATLTIYDPMFKGEAVFDTRGKESLDEAIENADCIVIGTAHTQFKNLDLARVAKTCNRPAALVDTQHVTDPLAVKKQGMAYRGVGRLSIDRSITVDS